MKQNTIDKTNRSIFSDGTPIQAHAGVTGVVKVHESVVASIIRKAACSVPGVIRLAGNTLVDNIAEFVGSKITGMQVPQIDIVVVDLEDQEEETSEEDENEESEPGQTNR